MFHVELRIWLLLVISLFTGFAVVLTVATVYYLARRVRVLESLHGIGENADINTHPHTCTRPN